MPRVIHFEINADEPEKLADFYKNVFNWEVQKWAGPLDYWLVMTGKKEEPGIDGGIMQRRQPGEMTINSIDVASVDEFILKIEASGGKAISPKETIPGVGYMAYCKDPQGNTFSIMQEDTNAK